MGKTELLQLSRQVIFRYDGDHLIIEQPIKGFSFPIAHSAILNILFSFIKPVNPHTLFNKQPPPKKSVLLKLVDDLKEKDILVPSQSADLSSYNSADLWQLHDLYFHTQSRNGSNLARLGATYRFGENDPPESYSRSKMWRGKKITLPSLDHQKTNNNLSLLEALESRATSYKSSELDMNVLSDLLAGSLRVKSVKNSPEYTFVEKFYPSGGALHSIETYLAVFNCSELANGLYYYNSLEHTLVKIPNQKDFLSSVLKNAERSMREGTSPSVIMLFSSRFSRVFWKYESLGYRLILIELGAIYQTLYLLAASLNLSVCALGSGDSSEFSRALNLNYLEETSIGEFAINGMY